MSRAVGFIKNKSNSWLFVVMAAFFLGLFSCCANAVLFEIIVNPQSKAQSPSNVPVYAGMLAGLVVVIVVIVVLRKVRNLAYEGKKSRENKNPERKREKSHENKNPDGKREKSRARLVKNVYLGHLISEGMNIHGNKTEEYSYIPYSRIYIVHRNIGNTEMDLVCGICGEKFRLIVKSKLRVRMKRLGETLILSVILLWMPVFSGIALAFGLIYTIILPISGAEGTILSRIREYDAVAALIIHSLIIKEEEVG